MIHTPAALHGPQRLANGQQSACTNIGALDNLAATGTNVVRFPDGTTGTIVCHGDTISVRTGGQPAEQKAHSCNVCEDGTDNFEGICDDCLAHIKAEQQVACVGDLVCRNSDCFDFVSVTDVP
jgi:hypothetical protein